MWCYLSNQDDKCQVEDVDIDATWQKYGNVFYFNYKKYIDIDRLYLATFS